METDSDNKGKIVANYFEVGAGSKLSRGVFTHNRGYVVNSSMRLYFGDFRNAMTGSRAKQYLLSLDGVFGDVNTFDSAVETFLTCHYVELVNGRWECDCKGYRSVLECGHMHAAMHLDNECAHDVTCLLRKIERPKVVGRPRKLGSFGFASPRPSVTSREECKAANLYGMEIAHQFHPDPRIFYGVVKGESVSGRLLVDNCVAAGRARSAQDAD